MQAGRYQDETFTKLEKAGSDLTERDFDTCTFVQCDFSKADLRHATDYQIDPTENRLKGGRFSREGLPGLLYKFGIRVE